MVGCWLFASEGLCCGYMCACCCGCSFWLLAVGYDLTGFAFSVWLTECCLVALCSGGFSVWLVLVVLLLVGCWLFVALLLRVLACLFVVVGCCWCVYRFDRWLGVIACCLGCVCCFVCLLLVD